MTADDAQSTAALLLSAGSRAVMVPPPSASHEFGFGEAYAVSEIMHRARVDSGRVSIGMKLGFTNRAIWDSLGLDAPFWSPMYTDTVSEDATVSLTGLVQPKVEPEIVLGLGSDLVPGASRSEVAGAVAWASVGIEMVHCHYQDWVMTPPDAVADGGLHAALRHDRPVPMDPHLVASLSETEIELERDGDVVETGVGANALGGPLEALRWLVDLPGFPGLRRGSVITTGTLTAALPAVPGQRWGVRATGPLDQMFVVGTVD